MNTNSENISAENKNISDRVDMTDLREVSAMLKKLPEKVRYRFAYEIHGAVVVYEAQHREG